MQRRGRRGAKSCAYYSARKAPDCTSNQRARDGSSRISGDLRRLASVLVTTHSRRLPRVEHSVLFCEPTLGEVVALGHLDSPLAEERGDIAKRLHLAPMLLNGA